MDYQTLLFEDTKDKAMEFVLNGMPRYLSSKNRVHKMFFKKCEGEITPYESCIENPKWYYNKFTQQAI